MVGWRRERTRRRTNKQQGDPRGGVQSDEYRHADPRDVVVDEGVAMVGPAGAPQEGTNPEERRSEDRS